MKFYRHVKLKFQITRVALFFTQSKTNTKVEKNVNAFTKFTFLVSSIKENECFEQVSIPFFKLKS